MKYAYLRNILAGAFTMMTALSLSSCAAVSEPAPVASPACDYRGQSGICVQFDADARQFDPAALERTYLAVRQEAEDRYQLHLRKLQGPIVHVVSFDTFVASHKVFARMDGDRGGTHGWTDFADGRITVTGPEIMRHESFHYVLWHAGYSNMLNSAHEHPAFDEYRDGRWLPRRTASTK